MDKKEILEKNKKKKRNSLDEREQRVYSSSFGMGAVVVGILCLVFSIYKAFHRETFYEFVTIITAYLCTTFLYQYKNIRKPIYLIAGIGTGIAAVFCAVMFFWVHGL
ncbi:MAG: hypothetical protein IJU51_08355 [Clostridia bacterium]|nr:hypothetical protein [Clostridia bacterium]